MSLTKGNNRCRREKNDANKPDHDSDGRGDQRESNMMGQLLRIGAPVLAERMKRTDHPLHRNREADERRQECQNEACNQKNFDLLIHGEFLRALSRNNSTVVIASKINPTAPRIKPAENTHTPVPR